MAVLSVVCAAAFVALAAGCGTSRPAGRPAARPTTTTARVATTPPTTLAPQPAGSTTAPGLGGTAVAVGAGSVWVGRRTSSPALTGEVLRIDPVTLAVQARVPVPVPPRAMAVSGSTVWVVGGGDGALPIGALVAIDARTNRLGPRLGPTTVPWSPADVAAGPDAVWVPDNSRSCVLRFDPRTGRATTIAIGARPTSVAVDGTDVWLGTDGFVWHVDATTNAARKTFVTGTSVVTGTSEVWVSSASPAGKDTTSLDRQGAFMGTSVGTPIRAHADGRAIGGRLAADGERVWVGENDDVVQLQVVGTDAKIVPGSYLALDAPPVAMTATNGTVWVVEGVGAPLVRWHPAL